MSDCWKSHAAAHIFTAVPHPVAQVVVLVDQDSEIQAVDLAVVDLAAHLVEVVEGRIKHSQDQTFHLFSYHTG